MKDIFELLNDSKVDFDKYENIELNDCQKEEIFNRAKTKIYLKKNKGVKYKKFTAIASIFLVCSVVLFCNKSILAFAKHSMDSFIGLFNSGELNKYQSDTSAECESSGIKIRLRNFVLDSDSVYYNVDFDMSNFDYSQIVGDDESIEIDKINIFTHSSQVITLDSHIFSLGSHRSLKEDGNIAVRDELVAIVNNSDPNVDYDDFDLFDILEDDTVKIKLDFQQLNFSLDIEGLTEKEINRMPITRKDTDIVKWDSNYSGTIKGNWEFEATINTSQVKNNLETYNIGKKYEFDHRGYNGYFTIDKLLKNEYYINIHGKLAVGGDKTSQEIERVLLSIGINDLDDLRIERYIERDYDKQFEEDGFTYYTYNYKYNVLGIDFDEIRLNPYIDFNSRYRTLEEGLKPDIQKYDSIRVNKGFLDNIQNTLKNMLKK